jgi:uncharacterized radical SAM superfamily Fe-S cluster-containing enzyme
MFVAGMHFMDSYNYNFRRVRRCIVQYVTTGGDLIPFCSYNAGPRFRVAEELSRKANSIPMSIAACSSPETTTSPSETDSTP